MNIDEFKQLIEKEETNLSELPPAVQALWYDKTGNWDKAHQIVQDANDKDSAWVHAYLHRKEGDLSNAHYWYRRSEKPEFNGELSQEWEFIARDLLVKL
ncbi:MAG: hypothetical protein AB1589_30770 [Cyanobacteriota bacterium]